MYRHTDILSSSGMRAFVLHQRTGFRCEWFENSTPVAHVATTAIGPDDLLVVPESYADIPLRLGRNIRHVVLNQGWSLTFSNDPGAVIPRSGKANGEALAEYHSSPGGPLAVIATSEYNAEFVRFAFPKMDVRQIRLSIDPNRFFPGEVGTPPRIVYVPKHDRAEFDAVMVLRMLESRKKLRGWEVRALTGLSEDQMAAELRSATIFLSVSSREGLGLPPLEAMASACYVVGYHAVGGNEYMRPEFSSPVEPDHVLELARALDAAIESESRQPGWLRSRGMEAAKFVLNKYTPERERADVIAAFADLI